MARHLVRGEVAGGRIDLDGGEAAAQIVQMHGTVIDRRDALEAGSGGARLKVAKRVVGVGA